MALWTHEALGWFYAPSARFAKRGPPGAAASCLQERTNRLFLQIGLRRISDRWLATEGLSIGETVGSLLSR